MFFPPLGGNVYSNVVSHVCCVSKILQFCVTRPAVCSSGPDPQHFCDLLFTKRSHFSPFEFHLLFCQHLGFRKGFFDFSVLIRSLKHGNASNNQFYLPPTLRRSVMLIFLSMYCEGEDLVSEPQDEMEELQGEGAAIDGRLPPTDPPHQNQPPPRPH